MVSKAYTFSSEVLESDLLNLKYFKLISVLLIYSRRVSNVFSFSFKKNFCVFSLFGFFPKKRQNFEAIKKEIQSILDTKDAMVDKSKDFR